MMWIHIWVYNIHVDVSWSTHRRDDIKLQEAEVLACQKALVLVYRVYDVYDEGIPPIKNEHSTGCLIS